jgi:hypothetical protein
MNSLSLTIRLLTEGQKDPAATIENIKLFLVRLRIRRASKRSSDSQAIRIEKKWPWLLPLFDLAQYRTKQQKPPALT